MCDMCDIVPCRLQARFSSSVSVRLPRPSARACVLEPALLSWLSELLLADIYHFDTELQAGVLLVLQAISEPCPEHMVAQVKGLGGGVLG